MELSGEFANPLSKILLKGGWGEKDITSLS
jgi:hypothetical protein